MKTLSIFCIAQRNFYSYGGLFIDFVCAGFLKHKAHGLLSVDEILPFSRYFLLNTLAAAAFRAAGIWADLYI
ncbi:hypothetical protein [Bacillus halotolerans]|uniref:hypothetical protein n=1 Tax=Bacillus halotolerans TaxID=260554 RepID=UPI0013018BBA|nr:hypothetical protein [Bacillus halotolerans]